MTKADIVEQIYEQVGFSKKESAELVEKVFDAIKDTLAKWESDWQKRKWAVIEPEDGD